MKLPYANKAWPLKHPFGITRLMFHGLLIIALPMVFPAWGAGMLSSENGGGDIRISADRLIARSQANYAEFTGNVHAVNDDMDITADILKVFYDQATAAEPAPETENTIAAGKTVREIVATGNVIIKFDRKTAITDKAVYTRKTGIVVMTGPDSRVTDESGYISGEKITLHTTTEQVTVESSNTNRVEAFINSTPANNEPTGGQTPDKDS
ncbi:MAG: LptA/OstA family protein [Thermodesulfobacteriota bacterium]|nr:LptA/OstA family protein [Thermodesulfobacteriota bacterium]